MAPGAEKDAHNEAADELLGCVTLACEGDKNNGWTFTVVIHYIH